MDVISPFSTSAYHHFIVLFFQQTYAWYHFRDAFLEIFSVWVLNFNLEFKLIQNRISNFEYIWFLSSIIDGIYLFLDSISLHNIRLP